MVEGELGEVEVRCETVNETRDGQKDREGELLPAASVNRRLAPPAKINYYQLIRSRNH